jgi:hypothetical protein
LKSNFSLLLRFETHKSKTPGSTCISVTDDLGCMERKISSSAQLQEEEEKAQSKHPALTLQFKTKRRMWI